MSRSPGAFAYQTPDPGAPRGMDDCPGAPSKRIARAPPLQPRRLTFDGIDDDDSLGD